MSYLICGIYEKRPKACRQFPQVDSYIPDSCGFRFTSGGRKGGCYLECQAACCMLPREGGEPGGATLPEIAGGEQCKYLEVVDEPPEGATVERLED